MPPIDPRLVRAKRFPVHAAVDRCNEPEVRRLVDDDAQFHLPRKIPDTELSVLHTACSARNTGDAQLVGNIVKYLMEQKDAPLNELDSIGQTPLHYAVCNAYSDQLLSIIISTLKRQNMNDKLNCWLQCQRSTDGWTPLHLAAMLGKTEEARILIRAGSDADITDKCGFRAAQIAQRFRFHQLRDILSSPRKKYRPSTVDYPTEFVPLLSENQRFREEHLNWRDENENSILHLIAWRGDVTSARVIFDQVKARKTLIPSRNKQRATPLTMAVVSGRDEMIEEFFQNKHAKKLIDLSTENERGENILHLLFQFCPFVHPKFALKRKDLTAEILNHVDEEGFSPFLRLCEKNCKSTVAKILANKNVAETLDLKIECKKPRRNCLHFLIRNQDVENFKIVLDRNRVEITDEILQMCFKAKDFSSTLIKTLLESNNSFDLKEHSASILRMILDNNMLQVWTNVMSRPDLDLNAGVDHEGNSVLMRAIMLGKSDFVEKCLNRKDAAQKIDANLENSSRRTLLSLIVEHLDVRTVRLYLDNVPNGEKWVTSAADVDPLLMATSMSKWPIVQCLINDDKVSNIVDVHRVNHQGHSTLIVLLIAKIKLSRSEQSHILKKEKLSAENVRQECETVWNLVKRILELEKLSHGSNFVQGRDGGLACIKQQMSKCPLIRGPTWDETASEYTRLFKMKLPAKKTSLPALKSGSSKQKKDKEENEAKNIPKITLDDLRDPAAFEAIVNSVASKIAVEKEKLGIADQDDDDLDKDAPIEMTNRKDEPEAPPRKRTPSFRCKVSPGVEKKPPRPDGPSPPPPPEGDYDENEEANKGHKKAKAKDSTKAPKRNDEKKIIKVKKRTFFPSNNNSNHLTNNNNDTINGVAAGTKLSNVVSNNNYNNNNNDNNDDDSIEVKSNGTITINGKYGERDESVSKFVDVGTQTTWKFLSGGNKKCCCNCHDT